MKWVLLSIIVVATVLSDLMQSREMKAGAEGEVHPRAFAMLVGRIARNGPLILSIFCMTLSFFAFMYLVQIAPLSFAVPASAATFVLETLLAKLVLREHIGQRRVTGTLLVAGGVILLAR